ncbi:non-ribosomal peptide synthetase module [Paenibacillus sp. HB172176]|uniref:non-ribosomal peptide synthetase module n=1 Tax=Paenibacillus sp. HB172176 TaxID=2493690 RepID=UPI00143C33EB|nr:non-ribosomal peptide synthetase module [Paenibacillus sp. HB172176]
MAKRLATEYVNAKLQLKHEEMARFITFMEDQQLRSQVLVLDNGNQELVLQDVAGREEIRLTFERRQDGYVCELNCRLLAPKLTNAMRKALSTFRGSAIVNRIYSHYTMIYHYKNGAVQLIVESTASGQRVVFEHKDTLGQLERVFRSRLIEREISLIQGAVNELLDLRNQAPGSHELEEIDRRLSQLTHKLFVLEA